MTIPKKIKIGPHIYSIKMERNLASNHRVLGQTRSQHTEIVLEMDQSRTQIEDTLIHEILHGINQQVKFVEDKDDAEEAAICRLSPALLQVIRDNPGIFK